jgi:hypothetical protein
MCAVGATLSGSMSTVNTVMLNRQSFFIFETRVDTKFITEKRLDLYFAKLLFYLAKFRGNFAK